MEAQNFIDKICASGEAQDPFEVVETNHQDLSLPSLSTSKYRKRDRDEYLANSSDAPLFSSDDLPSSSADNYLEHRQKRQYQRSWFEPEDMSPTKEPNPRPTKGCLSISKPRHARGPFIRNIDSGIWMGSDDSEEADGLPPEEKRSDSESAPQNATFHGDGSRSPPVEFISQSPAEDQHRALINLALQNTEDPCLFEGPVFPYWQKQPTNLKAFHVMQKIVERHVLGCLENGLEDIDLS